MTEMNQTFIIAAYSVTLAVVLGYLLRVSAKGSRVREDYERMLRESRAEDAL